MKSILEQLPNKDNVEYSFNNVRTTVVKEDGSGDEVVYLNGNSKDLLNDDQYCTVEELGDDDF